MSDDIPKYAFIVSLVLVGLSGAFLYGVIAQRDNLVPLPQLRQTRDLLWAPSSGVDSDISAHLQPTRGQGEGVTRNEVDDGAVILMVGFFDEENQARIVRRDGTVQAKWSLDYFEHFPDPERRPCDVESELRVDTHGALLTPAGELVFNYEYCGTVKLDRCGAPLWTLADQTHHSVIRAEAGGYWLLGRDEWLASEAPERFPPFSTLAMPEPIEEDTLLRIAEDGTVLEETSIPALMRDGGLKALLTATGESFSHDHPDRTELVHANKVSELPAAMDAAHPLFEAGDLAISLRTLNLVIVIDPVTKAVKWHQTGPWIRQHDPEFRPDGRISIFNNNVYLTAYRDEQTILSTPFRTNVIAVDPVSRQTEVIFGGRPGQEMLSVIRGKHQLLPDDGILITEFDAGRVLEVDSESRIVWEYINRYDDEHVSEVTDAAVYSPDYFETAPGACP